MSKIKIGDVFASREGSSATVIEYINSKKVLIEFNDNHNHKMLTQAVSLRLGQFKNPYYPSVCGVGYIGVGDFSAWIDGKPTYEYEKWKAMMKRGYSEALKNKHPTYKDCYVHADWHNFQNFAAWLCSNKYKNLGYELDKDVLVAGNKVYSEATCALVPLEINTLLVYSESNNGDLPVGVHYNKHAKKYDAKIRVDGGRKHLGYFDCPNEAHQAYVLAKEACVKSMAAKWKGKIDDSVYSALMSWSAAYE